MKISLSYPGVTYVGEIVSHQLAWNGQPLDLDEVQEITKSPHQGRIEMKDGTSLDIFSRGFLNREKVLLTGTLVLRSASLKREINCDLRRADYIVFDSHDGSAALSPVVAIQHLRDGVLPAWDHSSDEAHRHSDSAPGSNGRGLATKPS